MFFVKTIVKQGEKIFELSKENKALHEENRDNRYELAELQDYKSKTEKLKNNIIRDLFNLQDINNIGISEDEKNKHRNIIINHIINELSSTNQSFR